jgi:hypothetical protein
MKHWDGDVGIQVREVYGVRSATEGTEGRSASRNLSVKLNGRESKKEEQKENTN